MEKHIQLYRIIVSSFLLLLLVTPGLSYADTDDFYATLVDYNGDVSIQKEETDEWLEVKINMPIQKDDCIITGEKSFAEIFLDDGSVVKVEESSEINLKELVFDSETDEIHLEIFMKAGILLANIVEAVQRSPSVKVYTSNAVAGVRGTEFIVDATETRATTIGVFSGEVDAFGLDDEGSILENEPVLVKKGYQTSVSPNQGPNRPIIHNNRMLVFKKHLNVLRTRAAERRDAIDEIIQKRKAIKRKIIQQKKKVFRKRHPHIDRPANTKTLNR